VIPPFNLSGVLPPFVGPTPASPGGGSPYLTSMSEVVGRFATTMERSAILDGLLNYRAILSSLGISQGVQWIDGSFVEDVEITRGAPPRDIDIVTLAHRPASIASPAEWESFVSDHPEVFDAAQAKADFKCDAYYVDLGAEPMQMLEAAVYFHGLFSHQRVTSLWKGILAVPLASDDAAAHLFL
jgi:hypothetical protein